MRIAFFSTQPYDREFFDRANPDRRHELLYLEPSLSKETLRLAEGYPAICVFVNDQLDAPSIAHLASKGLKLIALRCAGFNNVDLEAADHHGVRVVRVPAYSPHAVAEHATALILTLNRKTHKAFNRVREGNFSLVRLEGFDLYARTVGVIGTGKIGQVFCQIMQGFGCQVIAYDKFPNDALARQGVRYVELPELLALADIVSLHCPLTPETHHLINAESLEQMKDGVMIINTSRGALIDTTAIIQGLKHRKVGYLGIDVYEQEDKLFFRDLSETVIEDDEIARLMSFTNVLVTAHQAFFTRNALVQIAETTLGNVSAFEQDQALKNELKAS
jgi:D-lactate dehydrogenase